MQTFIDQSVLSSWFSEPQSFETQLLSRVNQSIKDVNSSDVKTDIVCSHGRQAGGHGCIVYVYFIFLIICQRVGEYCCLREWDMAGRER